MRFRTPLVPRRMACRTAGFLIMLCCTLSLLGCMAFMSMERNLKAYKVPPPKIRVSTNMASPIM
jgi:hypothetical protein